MAKLSVYSYVRTDEGWRYSRASPPRVIQFPAVSVKYDPSACFSSTPFKGSVSPQRKNQTEHRARDDLRSALNLPMQGNCAEIMRLSVCLATERGIDVGATVHDALFYTAPADSWEEVDAAMKSYRFSEDLDFTLRNEDHLDEEFLQRVFEEIGAWVTDQSGLTIPADQLEFDIYDNSRGRPNCQGKIAYDGPVSPTSGGWPKIKLDLTVDERLVLPSVRREVFHPYSDRPEDGIWANCYAYEEAFEEKLRALGERTRPRDLMTW